LFCRFRLIRCGLHESTAGRLRIFVAPSNPLQFALPIRQLSKLDVHVCITKTGIFGIHPNYCSELFHPAPVKNFTITTR